MILGAGIGMKYFLSRRFAFHLTVRRFGTSFHERGMPMNAELGTVLKDGWSACAYAQAGGRIMKRSVAFWVGFALVGGAGGCREDRNVRKQR